MTARLLWASVGLASALFLLGYLLGGQWAMAPAALLPAAFWLLGYRRRWTWSPHAGLLLYTAVAGSGMALGVGEIWMLAGFVAALAAWDLSLFLEALRGAGRVDGQRQMELDHLRRLLLVSGLGLLLGALALGVRTRLSFWVVILLGFVGIASLSRAVAFLRAESD